MRASSPMLLAASVLSLAPLAAGCHHEAPGRAGLQSLVASLMAEARAGKQADVEKDFAALGLSDQQRADVYDGTAGKAPSMAYEQAWKIIAKTGPDTVAAAVEQGATDIVIDDIDDGAAGSGPLAATDKAKRAEVKSGIALYHVTLRPPLQELGVPLGDFAFVDGGWRYVLAGPLANEAPANGAKSK